MPVISNRTMRAGASASAIGYGPLMAWMSSASCHCYCLLLCVDAPTHVVGSHTPGMYAKNTVAAKAHRKPSLEFHSRSAALLLHHT